LAGIRIALAVVLATSVTTELWRSKARIFLAQGAAIRPFTDGHDVLSRSCGPRGAMLWLSD